MNLRLVIILPFILLTLIGCAGNNILIPQPNTVQEVKNIQVTYILPNDIEKRSCTFNGLSFRQYNGGTDTKIERLHIDYVANGLQVERRTDNGIAGSGIIYTIDANVIPKSDATMITLTPRTQKTYQEGLILPFPVPNFDIEQYLSEATLYYKFELNSEYPATSIKANFERLLERFNAIDSYTYILQLEGAELKIKANIYPYRNGSKVVINIVLYNKESSNGVIDVVKKIEEAKKQIEKIINS